MNGNVPLSWFNPFIVPSKQIPNRMRSVILFMEKSKHKVSSTVRSTSRLLLLTGKMGINDKFLKTS